MATTVKLRTISAVDDKRIQLSNSCCARKWTTDLGTSWNSIRVGCRISITDSGANLTSTPRLAFGIQSGITNLWLDANGPTNWCGIVTTPATLTRHAGPPAYYDVGNEVMYLVAKKVGTTLTTGAAAWGSTFLPFLFDATTASRSVIFLDILKGSPNYTFATMVHDQLGSVGDVSLYTYLSRIILATPTVANHNRNTGVTLAVSESAGTFDSVGISWDHSDALIEISDITVVRLS